MPSTKAQKLRRRQRLLSWGRLSVQIAFFLALPSLFSAGFNGFKYLFTQMGLGEPIEATSFLVTLAVLLALTVVFGRVFCGFACAFGTLGDVLHRAFVFAWSKTPFDPIVFSPKLVKALSMLKYLLLAAIGIACFLGVWSAVSGDSPWVAFAAILSGSVAEVNAAAFVLLGLIAVGMLVRERFFCQFFCPLGALFSLMPNLGLFGFVRNPDRCPANCGRCRKQCPVGIWPDTDSFVHGECIACGRCAAVCPLDNVSLLAIGKKRAADAAYTVRRHEGLRRRAAQALPAVFLLPAVAVGGFALASAETHQPTQADAVEFQLPQVSAADLQTRELPEERGGAATLELAMPEKALAGVLKDGRYEGSALCGVGNDENWKPYYLVVEIEVSGGKVAAVADIYADEEGSINSDYAYDAAENGMYLDRAIEGTGGRFSKGALEQIEAFIESGSERGGVDTVSGSTFSVVSIVQAYNRAVDAAVAAS